MSFTFGIGWLGRALRSWSGEGSEGVRAATEIDYLVKMNLAPLLGRRDAACVYLEEILTGELKSMERKQRRKCYAMAIELVKSALADTERVAMMLASSETSSREKRLYTVLGVWRNLLAGAGALSEAEEVFIDERKALGYFLPGESKISRTSSNIAETELRVLSLLLDTVEQSKPKLELYFAYNQKSFSTTNGERYQHSFEESKQRYQERENPESPGAILGEAEEFLR